MKKTVLTIAALLIFAATVYAGDIPEGLITNDSAKIFTAIVTDVNSEAVTLKVIHKIKGEVTEDEILSLPYFEFNWNTKASMADSCVITAIDGKSYYSFKTTSPKTNYTQYIVCGIAGTIIIALLILFNLRNISSKKCG